MGGITVIGNLARDTIDGGAPRVGGAPYHAARGLRLLGGDSRIVARCADTDRRALVPPLSALGVPVTCSDIFGARGTPGWMACRWASPMPARSPRCASSPVS